MISQALIGFTPFKEKGLPNLIDYLNYIYIELMFYSTNNINTN